MEEMEGRVRGGWLRIKMFLNHFYVHFWLIYIFNPNDLPNEFHLDFEYISKFTKYLMKSISNVLLFNIQQKTMLV